MSPIRTVVQERLIEVPAPDELADGTEVLVQLVAVREKVGLDESEWRDDPAALADWAAWLDTAEPVEFATPGPFEEEFPRFNVEAVAFALGDCVVVTGDTDLSDVPGLDVEDWSVPKASV